MRVEGISPRTWLLGTVTGWALVLWVLALAGMGSRVAHLPDDPSLVSRLPQLAPAPAERLGPLAQYANITAHPLFSTDRQPQPFYLTKEGDEDAQPAFDYVLTSVLITPVLSMAIVQPSEGGDSVRIKLGESADAQPAYRLTTINPRSAVFEGPDGPHTLELRVFDGTGGEPPTQLRSARVMARPGIDPNAAANADANADATEPAAAAILRPKVAPKPGSRPATQTGAKPPQPPADSADATPAPTPEEQMESIRKRIEQRRAQLREQAQNPAAPAENP